MFVLCMGIFGTTAFASVTAPDGRAYDNYVFYQHKDGSYYQVYSNSLFYVTDDGSIFCNKYWYKFKDGKSYLNTWGGVVSISEISSRFESNLDLGINSPVVPPVVAPTVQEAISGIVPRLSNQLKILLPVGVILLSIMLGVSFLPRLVHLFL